jgi:hypothetical protein
MADVKEKFVRIEAPAATVANYISQCGNTHVQVAAPVSIIEKLLKQGAKVVEVKEIKDSQTQEVTGYEEIELTLENYKSDNGGMPVPEGVSIPPDIEDEVAAKHAAEAAARLTEIGKEIKKAQDKKQEEFFPTQTEEGEDEEGVGGETPPPAEEEEETP